MQIKRRMAVGYHRYLSQADGRNEEVDYGWL